MKRQITSVRHAGGTIRVPGDKSIAHRAALLALLADDVLTVHNFPSSRDCQTSLEAVKLLGVNVQTKDGKLLLTPPEKSAMQEEVVIDCGNSGTTARLLAGFVSGSRWSVILEGDESLSSRPMKRIVDPLTAMGAELFDSDGHLPLIVRGKKLLPFEYRLPVASAQVKSALLLAGLTSGCSVTVQEPIVTRDHTERMIQHLGDGLHVRDVKPVKVPDPDDPRRSRMQILEDFRRETVLSAGTRLHGGEIDIPGDMSTAAYFLGAAAIAGGPITVRGVGLNPTRTAFLDYLKLVGSEVLIENRHTVSGEPRGDVTVAGKGLRARKVSGELTVRLIDEIPIVAVLASRASGTTIIRDAGELRHKESDRLKAIADNLTAMGINCGLLEEGLAIEGKQELNGADLKSFGDHRIVMAFAIAAKFASGPSTIDEDAAVDVSCPEFFDILEAIT